MRSEKNVLHGVDNNRMVCHFVSPSLARYLLILYLVLYPAVEASATLQLPSVRDAPKEADLMFRKIMNLEKNSTDTKLGCKLNRDLCAQIMNFLAQKTCGKFTTTNENASQFHHSPLVHEASYSSTVFERNANGQFVPMPLIVARNYWKALGELDPEDTATADRNYESIDPSLYNLACQRALRDQSAKCYKHQMDACKIIDDTSNNDNVVVHVATGYGKSGIWNYTLLARSICGSVKPKTIVICPYNSVLAQQEIKSKRCFFGTNLKVYSITSSTLEKMVNVVADFDLLYISIDAFNDLRQNHRNELNSWKVKVIYVDEYHLCLMEDYRHSDSWQGLHDVKGLNTKVVIVTATTHVIATKMIAHYMGIGENYITIGGPTTYDVPNVAFKIRHSANADLLHHVTSHIKHSFQARQQSTNFAIHVITVTKDDAVRLAQMVNESGIKAEWLTSDCTNHERVCRMQDWDDGEISVLASTYCVGLDNAKVKEVIIIGGCRSVADALQSAGRIRPMQQDGRNTEVIFWLGDTAWTRRCDEMQRRMDYFFKAKYFDSFGTEEEKVEARQTIANIFEYCGLEGIIYGTNQCIRKGLHAQIGVTSDECGICQYCISDVNHQLVMGAREREEQRKNDKDFVVHWMGVIALRCIACNNTDCDGFKCVIKNDQPGRWCLRCWGYTGQSRIGSNSYHSNETCNMKVSNIVTNGKACPHCFMAVGADIPDCGTREQHNAGRCQFKDRVKRILMDDHIGNNDFGLVAKRNILPVLQNHDIWYETMARNIKTIRQNNN